MNDAEKRLAALRRQHQRPKATDTSKPVGNNIRRAVMPKPVQAQRPDAPSRLQEMAEQERRARWLDLWRKADFPRRHRELVEMGEVHGEAWTEERDRVRDDVLRGNIVALLGPWGGGKTQMAASVAYEVCTERGMSAQYWRTADLLGRFKAQVFGEGMDEFKFMAKQNRVGLLVLDEFQDTYDSETEGVILQRLIDHRYGDMRATIVVSNFTPDQFGAAIGRSVMSRISECGRIVKFHGDGWQNYREAK